MGNSKDNRLLEKIDFSHLPRHIAVIMDGNGRWAKRRGLPRNFGHQAGIKTVRKIIEASVELKLPVITLYAFSVDNWSRPMREISYLMKLLEKFIVRDLENLKKENVFLKVIGNIAKLPVSTQKLIKSAIAELKGNTGLKLVLALNYGSRTEIVKAARKLADLVVKKNMALNDIDEEKFSRFLETDTLDDPDLFIRTSGEKRLSNFLLWQLSYAELYFTDKLWPDFNRRDFLEAIIDFQKRKRRYGGL